MEIKTYFFRGREVLVDGEGEAAEAEALAAFPGAFRFTDPLTGCTGVELPAAAGAPGGLHFLPVPAYFFSHGDAENARLSRVKGLTLWRSRTRFCPACGQGLRPHPVENALECPACGQLQFPRIEPCIITLVSRGDEILLLRNIKDREGIYACLAGFVEMGETLEQAVYREVMEETGLHITNLHYFGSQPWPYPCGLMVGFTADYDSGKIHLQRSELSKGAWFDRDHLPHIPEKLSIARQLLDAWLAATDHE